MNSVNDFILNYPKYISNIRKYVSKRIGKTFVRENNYLTSVYLDIILDKNKSEYMWVWDIFKLNVHSIF